MAVFQGTFFLLLGAGLRLVGDQGITPGSLPFGLNELRGSLEFTKDQKPAVI